METGFAPRLWIAAIICLLTAAAVVAVAGIAAGIVALVGGGAVLLLAARHDAEAIDLPGAPPSVPARDTVAEETLDRIVAPILLVRHNRVEFANRAALALFGAHILGEDVRIAIRHPAAAERLAAGGGTDDRPVELVGLGTPDQRWEMHVGDVADGRRVVQLIDRSGSYAAERMRIDFVANASHELRTPLASILGFIETLGDEAGEVPAVRARFLKVMFDEAQRMQRLVEDLISLSRIEAEKFRAPSEPVDLAALIDEICADLRSAGGLRGRDLACAPAGGVPPVRGDRAQLSQVIHNLVGNAMKYGRPGTPVGIALTETAEGGVRLAVADQGDGIAPEHIPRLTERFYRVDTGRSRSLGGTGLGLAIVKHIVDRHRGRLEIASRPGIGTTVSVVLPAADASKPLSSRRNEGVTGGEA